MADIMYFAIHTTSGKFFVGKNTQTSYTKIGALKSAIKYKGYSIGDFEFYEMNTNGDIINI